MLWEGPIYKFRIPRNHYDDQSSDLIEIVIDVSGSAPPVDEPSEGLKKVLTDIFESKDLKEINNVIEFGAAKLKNIPYILEKGKNVCAVDFKKLTENPITRFNLKKCDGYGSKFQKLIFPNPFITDKKKFDLALLLNVMPVMPIFAERLYALSLLYDKINDGKYLLWLAQREGSYKVIRERGRNKCGDGLWMGINRRYKTFYKYHRLVDLDEMMSLFGFKKIKRFSISDDARLYEKTDHNLFSDIITPEKIRKYIPVDESIKDPEKSKLNIVKRTSTIKPIIPNPIELSIESLYIEKIRSIPTGTKNAELYHRVVSHAIARIFRGSLRNMDIKINIDDGVKIIDTVFTNSAKDGFFYNLKEKAECSYPIFEMKNISGDPKNREFDQLNGRFKTGRGNFGILVCRTVEDEKAAYERCKTYLPDRYIFYLTDEEIFELLDYSRDTNHDDINDLMDRKLRNIIF